MLRTWPVLMFDSVLPEFNARRTVGLNRGQTSVARRISHNGCSCYEAMLRLCLVVSVCLTFPPMARAEIPGPCVARHVVHRDVPETAEQPSNTITIGSLNIAGQARIADALERWTQERAVDVLLLQEVGSRSSDGEAFSTQLAERLGVQFAYARSDHSTDSHPQGLTIVSRYAMKDIRIQPLDYFHLRFRSRCRIALAATVKTAAGDIRVVNVHLDTRINNKDRVAQVGTAVKAAENFDGPRLIAGDFNTMNIRWFRTMWPLPFLQRQSAAVRVWLTTAGFRTPFIASPPTFRFFGVPMRLDWLYLDDLQPLEWGVDRVRFTDHRAVWVRVTRGHWDFSTGTIRLGSGAKQ